MRSPQVSVVIPTRNRPDLVVRAVRSALEQTLRDLEVIVVVDGPDPSTREALALVRDSRLRTIELEESGGAQNARNVGAQRAAGEWTAFLDDDDEWLPEKLTRQLEAAEASPYELPVVACRLYLRTPRADTVLPRRLPREGEPPSEYLTVRRGLFHGEGFIQTSTIMAPTSLLRRVPFTLGVRRAQELDWSLRCLELPGSGLVYADQPLVIWYADENRKRVSSEAPWRQSIEWLKETRQRVTPRAYAALAMSVVASMAATSRSPRVFFGLLGEAIKHGRPGVIDFVTYFQVWLLPAGLRRVLRDRAIGRPPAVGEPGVLGADTVGEPRGANGRATAR
ncbi:glycosyltransferase family 2 protein [Cryptosporangium phraense]|uniref:glycosyltransferase family 2 protein n=1 Tax=Cryptosporangium phraense TaxID=2593070 RepID=UPI00197AD21A|nr:glycosyltransferase family 2 protein [Cryptosporangium phraense]